jgi:CheY-like chemotaxis protein
MTTHGIAQDVNDQRPLKVLVVDDIEIVLRVLGRMLRAAGHVGVCETSGEAALARLEALREPIDCLVTDMHLPGMSGLALAAAVRARLPAVPIVLLSGDIVHDPVLEHLGEKFMLLQKPVANRTFITAIETLCAEP